MNGPRTHKPLFTHAEHRLRASLMGRWYDWRDGTYVDNAQEPTSALPASGFLIDCNTFEPVDAADAEELRLFNGTSYMGLGNPLPMPWALPDEVRDDKTAPWEKEQ